ncbi:MAG: MFS transporter [Rhodobacteraceae bacterium]|nr:MFS transporter [Paracoccaceae bacterium]
MRRNIVLYPWFKFFQNLIFWQAIWFLYLQDRLSGSEAVALYAIFELSSMLFEVPSGYASDRLGRRKTLITAALCGLAAATLQINAESFAVFAFAQVLLGACFAFASGTDSALLYESLAAEGREDEVERHELSAWRFTFGALMTSALVGGLAAWIDFAIAYVLTAAAFAGMCLVAVNLREPPHERRRTGAREDWKALRDAFRTPALVWLFILFAAIHIFGHIGFVYGQPFLLDAMAQVGLEDETPLVSAGILAVMLGLSLVASLGVEPVRQRLRLSVVLIVAFVVQLSIPAALALSGASLIVLVLLGRMLPSAFLAPLIVSRIQHDLRDRVRATFISLKSLTASFVFALTLGLTSGTLNGDGADMLSRGQIQTILAAYVFVGVLLLIALALTARRAGIDD